MFDQERDYVGSGKLSENQAGYLDRIGPMADQAEQIADRVERFIARCRGGSAGKAEQTRPVASGHFGQLDRLNDALGALENLSHDLTAIG